ncbi:MAG: arylamine N-acetyltransferase [Clostridia bacterium]|nr:arylamine N-acetyltransferase [Clostridia bacterium]
MTQINAFLRRIGLAPGANIEHTISFLGEVQSRCVTTIPYENLDILRGKPISLEAQDVYDKIVTRGRGGYCFELNALLSNMLREMGFEVRDFFARYLRGEAEIPFRRHRIAAVFCEDSWYMMDIGVGQIAPRLPLKLAEGEIQQQGEERYRFERDAELGWILYDWHDGDWRRYISFTEERQYEVDFVPPSFWCEAHPASPFNKSPMIAIKTPGGRKTINDREFKEFVGERVVRIEENITDEQLNELLREEFGIQL